MTRPFSSLFVLLAAGLTVACSPAPKQDEEQAEALGRDTDETVFDDMIQTQDKARAVEDVTLQHKSDMDAAIDRAADAADGTEQ